MSDTNPQNSMEAEGLPEVSEAPPGTDVELNQDATVFVPRDHAVAAEGANGYAVTAAEDRVPEGVAERAAREEPDVGADELGVGGSVAASDAGDGAPGAEDYTVGSLGRPDGSEAVGEPVDLDALGDDRADDDVATSDSFVAAGRPPAGVHAYQPESGVEGLEYDDEASAVAYRAETRGESAAFSAEEAAVTEEEPR